MSAQNNVDKYVLNIFGNDKIFLEAGGSDPIDQNNTHLLEQQGWKGMIVEPKKDFNNSYQNIRKNTIVENFVLVSNDYKYDFIEGDFSHYMMGGIENIHNQNWKTQTYPCIQLQKLLDKHNFSEIHFFSLDVEGYEKEVLEGLLFDKTFIHLIVVECHIKNGQRESFEFLNNYGFKKVQEILQHDFYFNTKSDFFLDKIK